NRVASRPSTDRGPLSAGRRADPRDSQRRAGQRCTPLCRRGSGTRTSSGRASDRCHPARQPPQSGFHAALCGEHRIWTRILRARSLSISLFAPWLAVLVAHRCPLLDAGRRARIPLGPLA
ncbi:MAG TPA: hypothetical protein EYQ66_04215, partial [Myxococcales bacterium]|nr:hypothetical protein [Myxococcales bacterium]